MEWFWTWWRELRPWMKLLLGAIATLLIASAVSRQAAGTGWDFNAYYKAGERVLRGESAYVAESDFAYKYGPASLLPFLFFQLFSFDVARWIYCILHASIALAIPLLNLKILRRAGNGLMPNSRDYFWALVVGFAASLRFVDGEFQVSQVGLWIYAATASAVLLAVSNSRPLRYVGSALLALVSVTKIHSSIAWLTLSRHAMRKSNLWLFVPLVIVLLLPNPSWWLDWARQMKETTPFLPMVPSAVNRQGFFGAAYMVLGWSDKGLGPWALSLPAMAYAFFRLPRFSFSDLQPRDADLVSLTLSSWMLWGFMASPLPWQYTYSVLWGIFPLLWYVNQGSSRSTLTAIAVALAITPKGILGAKTSFAFEQWQGPFWLILIAWFLLVETCAARDRVRQDRILHVTP
ncbi:MAG TPA: glycosyltransferase 87 family protein [Bdellovibrionota bacterium]|nr:glycosyltransferase 87 family protein [Bdellovibrionota bacterium]